MNEICELYRDAQELSQEGAHIVSTDEMTGIQALEHKYPDKLPLLVQCALAAAKSTKKDPYFHLKYETLKKRRGHKKAIIAIARKMLVAIYHMIRDDADFLPVDHEDIIQRTKKQKG